MVSRAPIPRNRARVSGAALAAVGLAVFPLVLSDYGVTILTTILIYGLFAMSLDLLVGYTGMYSFGHAAFFGLGAYSAGLVSVHYTSSVLAALAGAMAVAAAGALVVGLLTARLRGAYFLMATLAFAQLLYSFSISNAARFAGGANGLPGISRPTLDPLPVSIDFFPVRSYYGLVVVVAAAAFLVMRALVRSPFGATLHGIRENESRMASLGYVTWHHKLVSFVVAGAFGGLAGALFALQRGFVSPEILAFLTSGFAFVMVIIGGVRTLVGAFAGAAFYVLLQDYVSSFTDRWQLIFGAAFIAVVFGMPGGVIGLARSARGLVSRSVAAAALHGQRVLP